MGRRHAAQAERPNTAKVTNLGALPVDRAAQSDRGAHRLTRAAKTGRVLEPNNGELKASRSGGTGEGGAE